MSSEGNGDEAERVLLGPDRRIDAWARVRFNRRCTRRVGSARAAASLDPPLLRDGTSVSKTLDPFDR